MNIQRALDEYGELTAEVAVRKMRYEELKERILGESLGKKLGEVEGNWKEKERELRYEISRVRGEIEGMVIESGETFRGKDCTVVYYGERLKIADVDGLVAWAMENEGVMEFLGTTKPFITIVVKG